MKTNIIDYDELVYDILDIVNSSDFEFLTPDSKYGKEIKEVLKDHFTPKNEFTGSVRFVKKSDIIE